MPFHAILYIVSMLEAEHLVEAKVNQYIYLQVESDDEEEAKQLYRARVADVEKDTYAIEIPIHEKTGRLKHLNINDTLSAQYNIDGGVKIYFNSTVLGFKEDTIKLVIIEKPSRDLMTKVQRRNYLRVPAELEVAVQVNGHFRFTALTEDLSGGGISFVCDAEYQLQAKDILSCWLLLQFKNDTLDHVNFTGETVRVKQLGNNKQLAMVKIIDIHDADRQKIVKYCFERQLELRK